MVRRRNFIRGLISGASISLAGCPDISSTQTETPTPRDRDFGDPLLRFSYSSTYTLHRRNVVLTYSSTVEGVFDTEEGQAELKWKYIESPGDSKDPIYSRNGAFVYKDGVLYERISKRTWRREENSILGFSIEDSSSAFPLPYELFNKQSYDSIDVEEFGKRCYYNVPVSVLLSSKTIPVSIYYSGDSNMVSYSEISFDTFEIDDENAPRKVTDYTGAYTFENADGFDVISSRPTFSELE